MLQSTEKIDKFYNTLDNAKSQCKLLEIIIIMKDLNVKVGKEQSNKILSK